MKQNVESRELDDYRVYLQGHLRDHHFPQRNNKKFIEQRVEDAYDRFVTLRLEGRSVPYAEEMALCLRVFMFPDTTLYIMWWRKTPR